MDIHAFEDWLAQYGRAWESRDSEAAANLLTPDALYYWTPFEEPKRGREGIAQAWREATSGQDDIQFNSEVLAVVGLRGIARWCCSLLHLETRKRVNVDGIFQVDFDEDGLCREFREWWHSDGVSEE